VRATLGRDAVTLCKDALKGAHARLISQAASGVKRDGRIR
jgi:hypothetical protein